MDTQPSETNKTSETREVTEITEKELISTLFEKGILLNKEL